MLTLLLGHFVPLKHLPADSQNEEIEFTLAPLVKKCKEKINIMVKQKECSKDTKKRPRCPDADDLAQLEGIEAPKGKHAKVDKVGSTAPGSSAVEQPPHEKGA